MDKGGLVLKSTVERQQLILERLEKENRVYVSDLGIEFEVSDVTIRKDLKELEAQGLLQRVHGSATTITKTRASVESTLRELSQSLYKSVILTIHICGWFFYYISKPVGESPPISPTKKI